MAEWINDRRSFIKMSYGYNRTNSHVTERSRLHTGKGGGVLHVGQKTHSDYETGEIWIPPNSVILLEKYDDVSMGYIVEYQRKDAFSKELNQLGRIAMIFETERLYLRELTQHDFDNLRTILQDKAAMYAYEHAFSNTEVQEWLDRQIVRYHTDGFGLWAVLLKGTDTFVGQAGLTMQDAGNGKQVVEIGYLFRRAYWHNGYATEAARGCRRYAFETLGVPEVYSIIRDNNTASQRVAQRNGMQPVGMLVKHYYGMDMPHILYCAQKCRIQRFQLEQLDTCMKIWLEGNLQAHNFVPAEYWQTAAPSVREALPQAELWVDMDGETVRGFIGLQEGYIAGLFVDEGQQGQGVGGGLLAFCQRKHRLLSLEVYERNERAVRFYQKHGFQITEKRTDEHTGESVYRMIWEEIQNV